MKIQMSRMENNSWSEKLDESLDSNNTLVLCFFDRLDNWEHALADVKNKFPNSTIIGCSSSGEIFKEHVFDHSFSVSICKFEKTQLRSNCIDVDIAKDDSELLGRNLVKDFPKENLKAILILSDGLNVNGSALVYGIKSEINNPSVIISGGLSGDGDRFKETNLIYDSKILTKKVIAIGLYGDHVSIGTGSIGGWDAFGPERNVTKSTGNVLYEIDGEPALKLYKQYLGKQAESLPSSGLLFPLMISFENRKNVVRTILAVNEADQSLTFAGDIPLNSKAQLMRANFNRLIEGAAAAGSESAKKISSESGQSLAIAISCVGRRLVLGQKTEDELEAVKNALPKTSNIIGFYSYGELSPNGDFGCELHNQTMTLTVLKESA